MYAPSCQRKFLVYAHFQILILRGRASRRTSPLPRNTSTRGAEATTTTTAAGASGGRGPGHTSGRAGRERRPDPDDDSSWGFSDSDQGDDAAKWSSALQPPGGLTSWPAAASFIQLFSFIDFSLFALFFFFVSM